jgi:predicted amidophosphoribosyltransferase
MPLSINPAWLTGPWRAGWALDLHTISSVALGDGKYDTLRSEVGEALFRLKYHGDPQYVDPLAEAAVHFLGTLVIARSVAAILPVPPSDTTRLKQPVFDVARRVGELLPLVVDVDYLVKRRATSALKDISDPEERHQQLAGAFGVRDDRYAGKRVLLFDDLYRSGETLAEITRTLMDAGVDRVYVLTLTRTRSRR